MGSVRWAAERVFMSKRSPLEVFLPWKPGPYHEALPVWLKLSIFLVGWYRLPATL
jgi:hypothetical protein